MVQKRKPYQTFTREFKLEAVRLMAESDRPSSEIAMELGIRRQLSRTRTLGKTIKKRVIESKIFRERWLSVTG